MTSKSAPEACFILIPNVGGDMLYPTCARLKECSCSFEPHTLYETARGLSRALFEASMQGSFRGLGGHPKPAT
jgi:hypothetical protein